MKLIVNGKERTVDVHCLSELVKILELQEGLVVTEIDGEIIESEKWEATELKEGMKIEIVHFVGGG